eukprot:TRINITY_DN9549_c0_g1_i4.p1 TRINITY_DN9549_c0_g1~~TRINITY_DN9549_c0_g1_i4.p1  ORF type:complete len:568 (+),score=96.16 TRINITY_DN9549_c0_g1_i4:72-1775(+)
MAKTPAGAMLVIAFAMMSTVLLMATGVWASARPEGMVDYQIPEVFFQQLREEAQRKQPNEWFTYAATLVRDYANAALGGAKASPAFDDLSPYYRFIPVYEGSIMVDASSPLEWSGGCFQQSSAIAKTEGSATDITVQISVEKPKDLTCSDFYILFTMENFHIPEFFDHGTHTLKWDLSNSSAAELYDVNTNGIRVFRFISGRTDVLAWVAATADLFVPALLFGPSVPDETAKLNLDFLQSYANVTMPPRDIQVVTLNESDIHSGDFLGVIRLDGLDPMLAFGMGAHTGHTTVALWIEGELYICESTTNSHYWPTNGIQKTPYKQWIQQALAADYQVVHLPLSPQYQAIFNETSAIAWVNEVLGMPYGFHNMLFCWIDTVSNNFPCLPPDFSSQCLHPYVVQGLAGLFDRFVPEIANSMWNQALNMRLNTKGLGTADAVYVANTHFNMSWSDLLNVPEQDEWYYSDGYSMVCDVFVCSVWKHAGLFGDLTDQIQCTEFTNWDAYSLNIFDSNYVRPSQCVTADPDSQFCQLLGKYRMSLPGYNSKMFYANMAEKCPSEPPSYVRPSNC